ncbi:hypothetical protein O181_073873 [Austropuccinia psidii MF-1]|uniref:Uncharacterized protein n=1 Tax=Austropuccinia psidii MF-1 TaxID=1389203 RepID=A0A9Q3IAG8_9BASI|nr:hypothetical protein [Austropuccinia psidii MF-1]
MYYKDIWNSKSRYPTIGTNKDKEFPFGINHMRNDNILKEPLEDFKEEQYATQFTSNMKLHLLKPLRKHRVAFSIGKKLLGRIKGHDIELYLDLERPHQPILRRPTYPAILENRCKMRL